MKCPVCKSFVMEHEDRCPQCGWIFTEDASAYGVLFGEMQIEACRQNYRMILTQHEEMHRNEDVPQAESPATGETQEEPYETFADYPWRNIFDWIDQYSSSGQEENRSNRQTLTEDEWAHDLTQSVMQMMDPEKNRQFRESVEQNFLNPWREELIRDYGFDPEAELGTYDYEEDEDEDEYTTGNRRGETYDEDEYVPDPSMPIYQWLNWQRRRPRNLKTVLGPALQIHNQKTGSRKKLIDEICDRIANGSFDNLYVGDYFDVTMPGGEKVRLVLAGFSSAERTHMDATGKFVDYYAVVVPYNCLEKKAPMSKSFLGLIQLGYTEETDYESSYMYNEVLPGYAKSFQRVLNNHILHRKGAKELQLLNLCHLYGNDTQPRYYGFPLFALHPDMIEADQGFSGDKNCPYWLSDQVSEGYFLNSESREVAEHKKLGVRPYFCIG